MNTTEDGSATDSTTDADPSEPTAEQAPSSDDPASDDPASDDPVAEADEPTADPGATLANYPQVDVIDLGSGDTVDFAEQVAGGSLPTLIWFWAPH